MSGDPMMVLGTNTPSVDQQVGSGYSEYFQKVMRGEFTDDTAFAYIARVDKDDDPFNDESCWIKSLPALGITKTILRIFQTIKRLLHVHGLPMIIQRLLLHSLLPSTIESDVRRSFQRLK
jgi:hypothetical protein